MDVLGFLVEADGPPAEVISTKEFLSRVEDLKKKVRRREVDQDQLVLSSLYVEALNPSIDTKLAAKIIKERVKKSDLVFNGIDWRWVVIYLALTMTPLAKADNKVQGLPLQKKS